MMEAMSRWQKARTWLHLFAVGVRRRMVIGARLVLVSEGRFLLIRHLHAGLALCGRWGRAG
jgi:hypothetical protein